MTLCQIDRGTTKKAEQTPTVDVLIPVRNRDEFITACLDSVWAQTLQPGAVIVVDDGSSDETPNILIDYAKRWPKLRLIRSEPKGVAHARNLALAASEAPFVAFLDSDDVWLPNKLECQMAIFATGQPELGLVHCGCIQIDAMGQPLPGVRAWKPSKRGNIFDAMVSDFYHLSGSASAIVARRDLITMVGGFDESLTIGEDRDLWLRLARISNVDYVPDALVALRIHPKNTFRNANPECVFFQQLRVWNKCIVEASKPAAILDAFRVRAAELMLASALRTKPNLGLYHRLQRSDLNLARLLFASRRHFIKYVLEVSAKRCAAYTAARLYETVTRCLPVF
jgi:glycosyltransferase involved in cell wall biosynthesis